MDLHLHGKSALVFGASGGLGGAIAEALAAEGARVAIAGRDAGRLDRTARRMTGEPVTVPWDLADLDAIPARVAEVQQSLGDVDIVVHMTGGPPPTTAAGQSPADWVRHFEQMVVSVIAITDALLPGMRERGWGRVITNTSSGVIAPIPGLGISNTLRAALVGWSKTLSSEVAADGVTCNIVVPGRIATDRLEQLDTARAQRTGRTVEQARTESIAQIPVGRYGDPSEYADLVAFLASPRAAYITGSVLRVDGGLIASV